MVVRNQRKAKDNAEITCRKSKKESSRLYLISFSSLLFKKKIKRRTTFLEEPGAKSDG